VRPQIIAAGIAALIATVGTVLLLEFNIRVSRAVDLSRKLEPLQKARVNNVLPQWNNISAYGQWIGIYRVVAAVVAAGSIIAIALALLV